MARQSRFRGGLRANLLGGALSSLVFGIPPRGPCAGPSQRYPVASGLSGSHEGRSNQQASQLGFRVGLHDKGLDVLLV